MNVNFNKWAPICFLYERESKKSMEISQELKKGFLSENIEDERSLMKLNYVKTLETNSALRRKFRNFSIHSYLLTV